MTSKRNSAADRGPLPPGSILGILGGGQLGRMTAIAAARLGYKTQIYCPDDGSPASQVANGTTVAPYDDRAALTDFVAAVDVVTTEFEDVPADTLGFLEEQKPIRPAPSCQRIAQDRWREKSFLAEQGIATARFARIDSAADLGEAVAELGTPAVLKTRRFGYDGKGQARVEAGADLDDAWRAVGAVPSILESFVAFDRELSVIVARSVDGESVCYVPVENVHTNHILDTTTAPAAIPVALAAEAEAIAQRLVEALDLVGLLAVEMFGLADRRILVNEIAPRPHNSGHWTIDACAVSQFEQFVRAVCGLPLGSPERHSDAVMTNLIGDDAAQWHTLLKEPEACVHFYGKRDVRPGRKMGHVTRLRPRSP